MSQMSCSLSTISCSSRMRVWMSTFMRTSPRSHLAKSLDEYPRWECKSDITVLLRKMLTELTKSKVIPYHKQPHKAKYGLLTISAIENVWYESRIDTLGDDNVPFILLLYNCRTIEHFWSTFQVVLSMHLNQASKLYNNNNNNNNNICR